MSSDIRTPQRNRHGCSFPPRGSCVHSVTGTSRLCMTLARANPQSDINAAIWVSKQSLFNLGGLTIFSLFELFGYLRPFALDLPVAGRPPTSQEPVGTFPAQ
jgi:hypothetical protein